MLPGGEVVTIAWCLCCHSSDSSIGWSAAKLSCAACGTERATRLVAAGVRQENTASTRLHHVAACCCCGTSNARSPQVSLRASHHEGCFPPVKAGVIRCRVGSAAQNLKPEDNMKAKTNRVKGCAQYSRVSTFSSDSHPRSAPGFRERSVAGCSFQFVVFMQIDDSRKPREWNARV